MSFKRYDMQSLMSIGKDEISAEISFCKDIYFKSNGRNILDILLSTFAHIDWVFPWDNESGKKSISDKDFSMKEYLAREWERKDDGIAITTICASDKSIELTIHFPPKGGSRLLPPNPGNVKFHAPWISISIKPTVWDYEMESKAIELVMRLSLAVEASYSNIKFCNQGVFGRLHQLLEGIFWVTFFGPDYVGLIGRDTFENLPCEKIEWLADGSAILVLTPTLAQAVSQEGLLKAKQIQSQLGDEWFRPRKDPKWYPKLRNLIIPE